MKLEIFRVGKHVSNNGMPVEFTESDLKAAVAAYDPALHEAPLVIGHPQDGAPAYGWIKGMEYNEKEQKVYAELDQVDDNVKELVNAGRYKKRSASWYAPTNPNNPKPGSLYIRHLGLLGAQAPALKGMPNISFADSEETIFEFGESSMLDNLKAWITSKFGADEAALAFGEKIEPTIAATPEGTPAQDATTEQPQTENFSEEDEAQKLKQAQEAAEQAAVEAAQKAQAEADAKAAELAAAQAALAAREDALKTAEIASFCEGLIKEGKMLPAEKNKAEAIFSSLYKQSEQFDFSENGEGQKVSAADALKEMLAARPKIVDFSEIAAEAPQIQEPKADFIVATGCVADPKSLAVLAKAQAHMKATGVDLQTALKQTAI